MPRQHCRNTPTPFFPFFYPGLSDDWPISYPQGIETLHTVIAFADPIADPIESWENDINWWSNPITTEFCEQVTFVLQVGPNVEQPWFMLRLNMAHVGLKLNLFECEGLPLGQCPPGAMLVGEDVDNFLL